MMPIGFRSGEMQMIGPTLRACLCCGSPYQDRGCVRGFLCVCPIYQTCRECQRCKRHCECLTSVNLKEVN